MAITASKLVYDILEIASSGGNPNEFKIDNSQILYWVEQTRAILIGQSLNKRDDVNDSWVQYINCLELETVSSNLCCDVTSDCLLLRSVQQLPSTIDTHKDNWVISVSTMDGSSINKSNPIKHKYQKYNKFTKNERSWFLMDNYLYIINETFLEKARVALIAEFPSDLKKFVSCDGQACWSMDSNFPVSLSMASQITDIVIKTKVNPFMQFSSDSTNNANNLTPRQASENKQSE